MPDREHAKGQATLPPVTGRTPGERRGGLPDEREPASRSRHLPFAAIAVGACLLAGLLSVLLLPSVPSFDPFAWIVWGREVSHLDLHTNGGPSWKPFPVLFTTVFSAFGGLSPKLWLVVARGGGLLALVAGYRLGTRLAGRWAGAVAVAALVLNEDWLRDMARGPSEPLLVAGVLWAILAHLEGHRRWAYWLGVGAALIRPEVWPFLGLYAIWRWREEGWRARSAILAGLALIPLLWFLPPWIGSGDPFSASSHATSFNGHLGNHPALEVLRRGARLTVLPALVGAAVALTLALRRRERLTLALGGGVLAWVALVLVMTTVGGYPGLGRFMLPAAAVVCVLGGVGAVRLVGLLRRPALAAVLALVLLAAAVPLSVDRAVKLGKDARSAQRASRIFGELSLAVKRAGGRRTLLHCARPRLAVNHSALTGLAWQLRVPLRRVRPALRQPGWVFEARTGPNVGSPPELALSPRVMRPVTRAGVWQVLAVTRPGRPPPRGCPA